MRPSALKASVALVLGVAGDEAWEVAADKGSTPTAVLHAVNTGRRIRRPAKAFWRVVEPRLRALSKSYFSFEGPDGFDEEGRWSTSAVIAYLPRQPQLLDVLFRRADYHRVRHAVGVVEAETSEGWFRSMRDYPRCFIQDPKERLVVFYSGPQTDRFALLLAELGETYEKV